MFRWISVYFILAILALFTKSFSQDCNLYKTAIRTVADTNRNKCCLIYKYSVEYDIKYDTVRIANKLQEYFSQQVIDSIIYKMVSKHDSVDFSSMRSMQCPNFSFLNEKQVIKRRKKEFTLGGIAYYSYLRHKKKIAVIYLSSIILFRNYAIVQVTSYVSSLNSVSYTLLLQKQNDAYWKVVDYLSSAAS
jgi:hypothetical protein